MNQLCTIAEKYCHQPQYLCASFLQVFVGGNDLPNQRVTGAGFFHHNAICCQGLLKTGICAALNLHALAERGILRPTKPGFLGQVEGPIFAGEAFNNKIERLFEKFVQVGG